MINTGENTGCFGNDNKECCSQTDLGMKVSREQFEEWINEECEIIVLDSGDGVSGRRD